MEPVTDPTELGITPVTVATIDQLTQHGGQLDIRVIHAQQYNQPPNPEVKAIKERLRSIGEQMSPEPCMSPVAHIEKETTINMENRMEDAYQVVLQEAVTDDFKKKMPWQG